MERAIAGYHRDYLGDWVADLTCEHSQHVRHRPPFEVRPWVLDAKSRDEHIGSAIDCPLCDRAELPEGLMVYRSSPVWDEESMPGALRHSHRVAMGNWGRITVHQGRLRFWAQAEPPIDVILEPGMTQAIPPALPHDVQPLGSVRFSLAWLSRNAAPSSTSAFEGQPEVSGATPLRE